MIKIGDKVKIVSCKLCGDKCPSLNETFEVIQLYISDDEFLHQIIIQSLVHKGRLGRICKARVRKIYD